MGIFDRFTRRRIQPEPQKRTAAPVPYLCYSGMSDGVDSVKDVSSAMKISAVYRCIDILSKGIAQLPLELKRNRGGYYTLDTDSRLNYLLAVRPNSRMNAFDFKRNIIAQMVTKGNAYVVPKGDIHDPKELILVTAGCCKYDVKANSYAVKDDINGINRTYKPEEILHFKNLSLDGYTGVSTISYASTVLAISSNADRQNVETFKKGGILRGFVSGQGAGTIGFGAVQDQQLNDVAANIEEQLASGKEIFSLPGEMKFNQISLSPEDMQLLDTKEFNVIEVCRFFGVHPGKVFAYQSGNEKSGEMSQLSFLTDTLSPYLTQLENEFESKVLRPEDYGTLKFDFNIEPILQTDLTSQADYIEKTIRAGVRTVNSWRKALGQEPVDGGEEPLVSANLLPLNSKKLWGEE